MNSEDKDVERVLEELAMMRADIDQRMQDNHILILLEWTFSQQLDQFIDRCKGDRDETVRKVRIRADELREQRKKMFEAAGQAIPGNELESILLIDPRYKAMSNLTNKRTKPSDQRPHQNGRAEGTKSGSPVVKNIEWMIDTGASVSVVRKSTADGFDLTPLAATASGTTGGGGILMKKGLTTCFEVIGFSGVPKQVTCTLDIGVKPNDSGSEIIGMDQIANTGAKVTWDPVSKTGQIFE
jgi:hypothetical protein